MNVTICCFVSQVAQSLFSSASHMVRNMGERSLLDNNSWIKKKKKTIPHCDWRPQSYSLSLHWIVFDLSIEHFIKNKVGFTFHSIHDLHLCFYELFEQANKHSQQLRTDAAETVNVGRGASCKMMPVICTQHPCLANRPICNVFLYKQNKWTSEAKMYRGQLSLDVELTSCCLWDDAFCCAVAIIAPETSKTTNVPLLSPYCLF